MTTASEGRPVGRPPDRVGGLERHDEDDFPYYDGRPVPLAGRQWWLVVGACVLGFAALVVPTGLGRSTWGQLVPAVLFPAIPLVTLGVVSRGRWRALFRPVHARDVGVMLAVWVLTFLVSGAVGLLIRLLVGASENPAEGLLEDGSGLERVMFFVRTVPQLLGEEVVTILPFLALLHLFTHTLRMPRTRAVVLAWLASSLVFGALHLQTYDWNLVQALVGIGIARLLLSLAYLRTKNILVSTGAHILNDWTGFALAVLGGSALALC